RSVEPAVQGHRELRRSPDGPSLAGPGASGWIARCPGRLAGFSLALRHVTTRRCWRRKHGTTRACLFYGKVHSNVDGLEAHRPGQRAVSRRCGTETDERTDGAIDGTRDRKRLDRARVGVHAAEPRGPGARRVPARAAGPYRASGGDPGVR